MLQVWDQRVLTSIRWWESQKVKAKVKEHATIVESLGTLLGNVPMKKEKVKEGSVRMVWVVWVHLPLLGVLVLQKEARKELLRKVIQKEKVVL